MLPSRCFLLLAAALSGSFSVSMSAQVEPPAKGEKKEAKRAARILRPGVGKRAALTQADYQARFEKKMAGKWIQNAAWSTDLDKAGYKAQNNDKLILAYFTRSYSP